MNDNQFAELLSKIKECFEPLYVLLGFCLMGFLAIVLILYFVYYDETMRIRKKNHLDEIRNVCRDELNKRDSRK